MNAKTSVAAGCLLALAAASAGIVPDVDLKLTPWKTKAEEWRGAPAQGTSVTDWTGYDRLAFDVVSYAVGGDPLNIVLRSPKPQGGMVHVRTPCFDAHTYEVRLERFSKVGVDLSCVTGMSFSVRWAQATDIGIRNVRLLRKGETAEDFRPDAKTAGRLKALRAAWEIGRAEIHGEAFARWRSACAAAGTVSQGAVFGKASPMLMVRPLSTQRLENFRDGLEDLWYARLYREKFGKDAEVPDAVVKSLREFTRDPKVLQAWRDKMADKIETR